MWIRRAWCIAVLVRVSAATQTTTAYPCPSKTTSSSATHTSTKNARCPANPGGSRRFTSGCGYGSRSFWARTADWRDPQLQGNQIIIQSIDARLPGVAVFISVLSPRYVKSESCKHELDHFVTVSGTSTSLTVADVTRVFKVVKTPVQRELEPAFLQHLLGYEFYVIEPHSGRTRELGPLSPPEVKQQDHSKLDDLAHDVAQVLTRPRTPRRRCRRDASLRPRRTPCISPRPASTCGIGATSSVAISRVMAAASCPIGRCRWSAATAPRSCGHSWNDAACPSIWWAPATASSLRDPPNRSSSCSTRRPCVARRKGASVV